MKLLHEDDVIKILRRERQDCIEAGAIGAANTCGALIDAIASLPAAEGGRPPMLFAAQSWSDQYAWWHRCDWIEEPNALWRSLTKFPASEWSTNMKVDRTASDEAALKLYDADLTSGDAAKQ